MGVVKPMAVVSASRMCGSARNHSTRPSACTALRQNRPAGLYGRLAETLWRSSQGVSTSKANR